MTPERFARIQQVLQQRQPDLTLVMDAVHKTQNLSAIVRSCDALGVHEVHSVRPDDGYRNCKGTAKGSSKWVRVRLYADHRQAYGFVRHYLASDQAACHLNPWATLHPASSRLNSDTTAFTGLLSAPLSSGEKVQIVAAHFSAEAEDYRNIDYCRPTAIVMGAEKEGISAAAAADADVHIQIPMVGMVQSFNVSVAAALILNEAYRQRLAAGYYAKRRLCEEEYRYCLFRWSHPRLAQFCDQRRIAYPDIDEQGHLIQPADWYQAIRQTHNALTPG